ncbi:metallopeptidase family protein [Intrasporangium sp. YIM S08009]|uniref:metallopeptidase family protein n=1 Tax=Intrasporangium zincisolvens TaxID=3080018 RepID=UPI002B05EF10|nr:metallopeptidase family protein [Intrasporangium sp. YIM S08009]
MSTTGSTTGSTTSQPVPRRRDRHGRGRRGPLAWPPVPAMVSRRDEFDDYVLDAAARLEATCGRAFPAVEFAVEDVPRGPAAWDHREVPLGRLFAATGARPARIVVYRRPVETRVSDRRDVAALVADIVTEQVAGLLGVSPEELDPGFGD